MHLSAEQIEELLARIREFKDYVTIVEGKKDVAALQALGFTKIYQIHEVSVPMRERVEDIMKEVNKKDKVCILTDLDKKGKQLYLMLKPVFQEHGAHLDSSLRSILLKARISHIEGLYRFVERRG